MFLLLKAVRVVPEGMAYTVERSGKYRKTLLPGQSLILPFIDRISYRVSTRERKLPVRFTDLKTKDNQEVLADADVYVTVKDAYKVAYETGDVDETLRRHLNKFMISVVKSRTLKTILGGADEIDKELLALMQAEQDAWGVEIGFVDVHKIYPAP